MYLVGLVFIGILTVLILTSKQAFFILITNDALFYTETQSNSRYKVLRPVLLIVRAGSDKNKWFVYKIRESLTVPKQELACNSKSSNKSQKLPTYSDSSVDRPEKMKRLKTLICTEYIGEKAILVQFLLFLATLQFSLSFIQPVDTLIRHV